MDMPQTSLQLTPKGSKIVLKGKDSKLSILHLDKWWFLFKENSQVSKKYCISYVPILKKLFEVTLQWTEW